VNYFYDDDLMIPTRSYEKYDFHRANYDQISSLLLRYEWNFDASDLNLAADILHNRLTEVIEECVPKKIVRVTKSPPWYDKMLINLKNKKSKAHRKWNKSKLEADLLRFDALCLEFQQYESRCYENFISKTSSEIKSNPRKFYSYVDYKKKAHNLPNTMQLDENVLSNESEISNKFAQFFESVYADKLAFDKDEFDYIENTGCNLTNMIISHDELLKELLSLDGNKNAGPDNIPPIFLKKLGHLLVLPLLSIFNASLAKGVFPDRWKISSICPIFKSGDRKNIKNYRGIAILSAIPKLFEKIVTSKLYDHLLSSISIHQHGFMKGRSAATNLSDYTSFILLEMEKGNQVDAVYTDFSKAFDKVDHGLLVHKLSKIGVNGSLLNWISSYLTNRKQFVRINNTRSDLINVTSGVPQGSHLGPLLFSAFINDLTIKFENCKFLLFADDLKIYVSIDNFSDHQSLQSNLNVLDTWCRANGMVLNVSKCCVISFSRRRQNSVYDYFIGNSKLVRSELVKDLGVLMDTKLSFKQQVDRVYFQAKCKLGFVKRMSKEFNDPYVTKALYCSLVRPTLEYCSIIWSPMYECDIKRLESVQKQFLIFALRSLPWDNRSFQRPPYTSRLQLLTMKTLQSRRLLTEALFAYDLVNKNINSEYICSKITINTSTRVLRNKKFLIEKQFRSNYSANEPFNRCSKSFNQFSRLCGTNTSKLAFRNRILEIIK
jgi:hypothetical protein